MRAGRALLLLPFLIVSSAFAQTGSAHQRAAQLFAEGRALVESDRCHDAIPKFEKSLASERSIGALSNLGECLAKEGRALEAWRGFKEAERLAAEKHDPRGVAAKQRAVGVETKLLRITVVVDGPADGVAFTVDGEPVAASALLEGYCVEPGRHAVTAKRGDKAWKNEAVAGNAGGTVGLAVSFPVDAPPAIAPVIPTVLPQVVRKETSEASSPAAPRGSTQRTLALVTGGVGLAALGAGTVFGFIAKGRNDDYEAACFPKTAACDPSAHDSTISSATTSTVFFIGGGLLTAAGAVLYFTAPSKAEAASAARVHLVPTVTTRSAGLSVGGAW